MVENATNLFGRDDDDDDIQSKELIQRMAEPCPLVAQDLDRMGILHPGTRDSATYNAFRELRTELFSRHVNENFVTLVTSVTGGGGGTHVAINLACSIALDPAKTALVVDCNFANPSIHEVFGLDQDPGMTDFLADPDDISMDEIIQPTGVPRLRAIAAGGHTQRNSEYFATMNMRLLVHMLQQRYSDRYVVIDGPSAKNTADARMLSGLCDNVLVVVPHGRVTASKVQDACQLYHPEKLAGVVLNSRPQLPING